jgi:NAD-dependent SIR2 family protein deacetylase
MQEIKQIINEAEAILITAGSGMGVDSGLPDFRGDDGFWKAYPIAKELNLSFQEMANPIWFITNPPMAWAFYGHRYNLYKNTIPHDGFKILLDLVKTKNDNYFIFTSNVDGQFQKAGFDSEKIIECHGSISYFQCSNNCKREIWEGNEEFEIDMDKFESITIPLCPECGDIARPNILMFGDWKWNYKRTSIQQKKYSKWLEQNKNKKILIIELGAGTTISTVRRESETIAKYYNGKLIRINPLEFNVDEKYGFSISAGAKEGLMNFYFDEGLLKSLNDNKI